MSFGGVIRGLIALFLAFVFVKYRYNIVEQTGKFEWAERYLGQGGTYNFILIIGAIFFFWGIGSMTGTTHLLFAPIIDLFFAGKDSF